MHNWKSYKWTITHFQPVKLSTPCLWHIPVCGMTSGCEGQAYFTHPTISTLTDAIVTLWKPLQLLYYADCVKTAYGWLFVMACCYMPLFILYYPTPAPMGTCHSSLNLLREERSSEHFARMGGLLWCDVAVIWTVLMIKWSYVSICTCIGLSQHLQLLSSFHNYGSW